MAAALASDWPRHNRMLPGQQPVAGFIPHRFVASAEIIRVYCASQAIRVLPLSRHIVDIPLEE